MLYIYKLIIIFNNQKNYAFLYLDRLAQKERAVIF
jgi:hypothetical protein